MFKSLPVNVHFGRRAAVHQLVFHSFIAAHPLVYLVDGIFIQGDCNIFCSSRLPYTNQTGIESKMKQIGKYLTTFHQYVSIK